MGGRRVTHTHSRFMLQKLELRAENTLVSWTLLFPYFTSKLQCCNGELMYFNLVGDLVLPWVDSVLCVD